MMVYPTASKVLKSTADFDVLITVVLTFSVKISLCGFSFLKWTIRLTVDNSGLNRIYGVRGKLVRFTREKL
jgi:hypothetical protein